MLGDPIFWLFVLPGLLLGTYAQSRIKINIARYSQVGTQDGNTAARTSDVLGARWDEIDFKAKTWTIPAARMKSRREHRVPLSDRVVAILKALRQISYSMISSARARSVGGAVRRGVLAVLRLRANL